MDQIIGSGSGSRALPSWIEGFSEYTSGLPSPEAFRYWTGISTVAAALERRVWLRVFDMNLVPNLYVILTGPPGVGKTVVTSRSASILSEISDFHLAPSTLSAASFRDDLLDAKRRIVSPGNPIVEYNALTVISNELGSFITAWDNEFISQLTDVFDGFPLRERKRSKDLKLTIERPCVNILAATTPSWLMSSLPAGAWEQGFTARTLFIYSGETTIRDLWGIGQKNETLRDKLVADIKSIAEMHGEFRFTQEAGVAISNWHMAGGPPKPNHPKLVNYVSRRTTHLLKLCIVFSAARGDSYEITIDDYTLALDALSQMEFHLPDIFLAMAGGGDGKAMEEAWHFVYTQWMKSGADDSKRRPVFQHTLIAFLRERVPSHSVMRVIEIMEKSKMIEPVIVGTASAYKPAPKLQNFS